MVEFRAISKSFGEHKVLSNVTLTAKPGDVVALMGENGAGKSTLMRILAGVYPVGSYSGDFFLEDGKPARFHSVQEARRAGITMIHQELGLFPELTVAENLLLEELAQKNPFHIRWNEVFKTAQEFLDSLGFVVNARVRVGDLRSTGDKQLVEIARALRANSKIVIMDEPTSALTETEAENLFKILKQLREQGKIIFYISHRMDEIARIATQVTVLRDGEIAGTTPASQLDRDQIIRWMVGREVTQIYPPPREKAPAAEPVLKIKNLTLKNKLTGKTLVSNVSFDLHPGEVLGLAGLMGAGRSELALAVFGAFTESSAHEVTGTLWHSPAAAIDAHVAMLTEDRKGTGLLLNRPAAENITLSALERMGRAFGVIPKKKEHALVKKLASDLNVRGPGLHAEVGVYSGGNQQKVALAKCLALEPKILILDEPTRGVDIGAKLEIYDLISKLAEKGVAILMISSELPELLGLSDRVLVLRQGEFKGEFTRQQGFNPEKIIEAASF